MLVTASTKADTIYPLAYLLQHRYMLETILAVQLVLRTCPYVNACSADQECEIVRSVRRPMTPSMADLRSVATYGF